MVIFWSLGWIYMMVIVWWLLELIWIWNVIGDGEVSEIFFRQCQALDIYIHLTLPTRKVSIIMLIK